MGWDKRGRGGRAGEKLRKVNAGRCLWEEALPVLPLTPRRVWELQEKLGHSRTEGPMPTHSLISLGVGKPQSIPWGFSLEENIVQDNYMERPEAASQLCVPRRGSRSHQRLFSSNWESHSQEPYGEPDGHADMCCPHGNADQEPDGSLRLRRQAKTQEHEML